MKDTRPKPARRRFTESERQEIITEYRSSGQSQASIASKHGISSTTLQNWLRANRKTQADKRSARLLPVHIVPGKSGEAVFSSDLAFEITLKSNHRLRVPSGFDSSEVRLLVKILEETC